MAESKKKKSSTASGDSNAQRPQDVTSGEMLRAARIQRGVGLEEISAAINVRVGQLRAIEEGDVDALPGMTYATGFVKSYAAHLKLNTAEIVQKFKAEQGVSSATAPVQNLYMPEPLAEGPRPNFFILGVAGFFVFLVLAAWAVLSGGQDVEVSDSIPVAPVVGTMTGIAPNTSSTTVPATGTKLSDSAPPPVQPVVQDAVTPPPVIAATTAPDDVPEVVAPEEAIQEKAESKGPVLLPVKPDRDAMRRQAARATEQAVTSEDTPAPAPIVVRRGKTRVVLTAAQASWLEITTASGETIVEKVLRPGEQFAVPDQPDLKLSTSNAGGLEVSVDGVTVQSLGQRGEIVSGVKLDPELLKVVKTRMNRSKR